ncbi:MAG: chemotaxis protein [Planctomycetia bacterium]|jgi:chemotaxis-related protein WspD|nr:chemotaxis protein [Planctomycetia bacterium]
MNDHNLPATETASASPPQPAERPAECWRQIGVAGDRSCPDLATYIHCRNCPVMAGAAEQFFNRAPPAGYLDEWRAVLDQPSDAASGTGLSTLIFRLNDEWFALAADVLTEVTPQRRIHRIPHRSNAVLKGMVNIRGQLLLCGSLHGLLGFAEHADVQTAVPSLSDRGSFQTADDDAILASARLLVATHTEGRTTRRWAFPVDEVAGVHRVVDDELRDVPSTLGKPGQRFSRALFTWHEHVVSLLAADRLFSGLHDQIPQ